MHVPKPDWQGDGRDGRRPGAAASGRLSRGRRLGHFARQGRVVVARLPIPYGKRRLRLKRRDPTMSNARQLRALQASPRQAPPRGAVAVARAAGHIAMLPLAAVVTLGLALLATLFTGLGWHTERY